MNRAGQGSLFDRLDILESATRTRTAAPGAAASVQAVKRHVEQLLNARQGGAPSCPSMGLPDFNDAVMGSADLLLRATAGIRGAIENNEPRIRVGDVRLLTDAQQPLQLRFRVDCDLILDDRSTAFEMELTLNGHTRNYSAL